MYKPETDYAVTLIGVGTTPLRPLRAVWTQHGDSGPPRAAGPNESWVWKSWCWEVHDPDDPLDFPLLRQDSDVKVHGEWNAQTHPLVGAKGKTWREFAEEQVRHLKWQRDIAARLTEIGIKRSAEPYIHFFKTTRAIDFDLTLTFAEIELLLRRGGA